MVSLSAYIHYTFEKDNQDAIQNQINWIGSSGRYIYYEDKKIFEKYGIKIENAGFNLKRHAMLKTKAR